ncbi:cysteine-rich receptor-like protein kinase 11 [Pistacia vera]|uniref:cysteine-rich receptor-like protein kinase 11 n=1 Tax=Pistacia vera TaxID=55513 RepID=UPI001263C9C9|nr:cysteine-rich receptor-like protein kinase 11 [Pistacia vera]
MRVHNRATGSNKYLLIILSTLISICLTTSPQKCYYNKGNFTTNSTYEINRNIILSSLASNITANGGFYNGTIGQDPDKVYARAVCRGDTSLESCAACISSATPDIMSHCPNQKEALSWGSQDSPCFVRYSNSSFFGILELEPESILFNTGKIPTYLTQFNETWESLMDRTVVKASAGSSRLKFATESVDLTSFQKIYALMQCTPDISQSDCDFCLRQSVADYQNCCRLNQGGIVRRPTCIFRWEMYPFYNYSADAPSLSPPTATVVPPSSPPRTVGILD